MKNEPAFPSREKVRENILTDEHNGQMVTRYIVNGGLSKRELFAAMAMLGTTSRCGIPFDPIDHNALASKCVEQADALIKALEKSDD